MDSSNGFTEIFLANGCEIYFNRENTIRTKIGFDSKELKTGTTRSNRPVNIISTSYIYIDLDVIKGSIFNGIPTNILYSFPNEHRYGDPISIIPKHKEKKDLYIKSFSSMKFKFYDENSTPINFQSSPVQFTLEIIQIWL